MYRAEVHGTSKVVVDQMKARERRKHLQEVRFAKSMIDNSMPTTMRISRKNPKKQQMIEDRYTEIERANRILLEKMSNIINGKHGSIPRPWKSGNKKMTHNSFYTPTIEVKPSLNSEKRRRELERINYENHQLLRRLQQK